MHQRGTEMSNIRGIKKATVQKLIEQRLKRQGPVTPEESLKMLVERSVQKERRIHAVVPQGIGDIFWVYQKLLPFFDKIHFHIAATNPDDTIQKRSVHFVASWPKVVGCDMRRVTQSVYDKTINGKHRLVDILAHVNGPKAQAKEYYIGFNRWLEDGVRLEQIDPGFPVAWGVGLPEEEAPVPYDDFVTLYVSGTKAQFVWGMEGWERLTRAIYAKLDYGKPLLVIGAEYDRHHTEELAARLQGLTDITVRVGMNPAQVNRVLHTTSLFIGYQSGLNILADNFGTPQVMIYFPFLKNMMYTWCQPGHAESGLFQAFTFDTPPGAVADALKPFRLGSEGG